MKNAKTTWAGVIAAAALTPCRRRGMGKCPATRENERTIPMKHADMTDFPKIALGAWAWGNDGTFGAATTAEELRPVFEAGARP